jgi:hypothetical protein
MTNQPPPPAVIVQHAKQQDASAKSHADQRAREAAKRAVEQATKSKGQPKTSGS